MHSAVGTLIGNVTRNCACYYIPRLIFQQLLNQITKQH